MMWVDVTVVGPFCAIDQWSALYGNTASVVSHSWIGYYCTHGHIEMDTDNVALLPVAVDDEIAVLQLTADTLAIHSDIVSREDIIAIGI